VITTFSLLINTTRCKSNQKNVNVVLVVIDTLRSDHLPFYGYHKNTSPFMWELSKKSIVFKNAFSASSWTSPATASIFTSLYPFQHQVYLGLLAIRNAQKKDPKITVNKIPKGITTITEALKENGYSTYGISDNLNIGARQGFTQGFDDFATFMYKGAPTVNGVIKQKWGKKLKEKEKYFLYIHYMDPHAPYHPREPWHKPNEDNRKNRISAYDSEINYVDQYLKELFELFKWQENTLLIITSDHGEGLWDHGFMGHGKTLYREEIQVPLLFYLPGGTKPELIDTNVSTIDIFPTVLELLGLPEDKNNAGVSLIPLINKQAHGLGARNIFSYLLLKNPGTIEWRTNIYKNWHFMIKLPHMRYLYSLLLDQKETDNRINEGEKIAKLLEKNLNLFIKTCKKYQQKSTEVELDKKKNEKLKSLGYVE
jgi:arylsulfatase A-like enzyme